MKSLKRRIVMHFYVPKNWKDIKVIKLHLNCLRRYSHLFNESLFVLSVDDVNDKETIGDFEHALVNIGFVKNVTFIVEENTSLFESKTLYDQLVSKMGDFDGITFFCHSKGIGNETFNNIDMNQLMIWVSSMYYLCLEEIFDVERKLFGVWGIVYGPFKSTWPEIDNKFKWIYSGTFFWVNGPKLYDYVKRNEIELRHCNDRFYSELFLGDILPFNGEEPQKNLVRSFNESYLFSINEQPLDFYDYTSEYLPMIVDGNTLKKIYKFLDEVKPID